jgi:hypothetical protein
MTDKALISLVVLSLSACTQTQLKVDSTNKTIIADGKYDTEFPNTSLGSELARIVNCTHRIFSETTYKTHIFNENRNIIENQINKNRLRIADEVYFTENLVAGSATVILNSSNRIALLSCAHIFDRPDTMLSYYQSPETGKNTSIASVSIKTRQRNFVSRIPDLGVLELEVLAMDRKQDIAILGQRWNVASPPKISVLYHPFGKERDLQWGTFVYIIGYPAGHRMIARGIVSKSEMKHTFIIDSQFNKGFSGGLIIAVKDGSNNFEVVGIVTSSAGEDELVLVPDKSWLYSAEAQYHGPVIIRKRSNIKYGITFARSADAIVKLVKDNFKELDRAGYHLSNLTN